MTCDQSPWKRTRTIQRLCLDELVRRIPVLRLDRRAESLVALVEAYFPDCSTVLDIGGGWGFYDAPLRKRGHQAVVLEVIKPAYQKAPVILYRPEEAFPFASKSFDVSLLMTVLHHIPHPEQVLREARRVTRHCIVVIEDLYHHLLGRLWTQLRDQLYNLEFFGHPCRFKKDAEWRALFDQEQLKLLTHQKVYTWLAGLRILNGIYILQPGERT